MNIELIEDNSGKWIGKIDDEVVVELWSKPLAASMLNLAVAARMKTLLAEIDLAKAKIDLCKAAIETLH